MTTFTDIAENFSFLDDWEDRYKYLIELGQALAPLNEELQTDRNKVAGCVSQVWVASSVSTREKNPIVKFEADSDAMIVKGIIAILVTLYSGLHAQQILDTDAVAALDELGLREHLTAQRSNGLVSMVQRMQSDARKALAAELPAN